MWNLWKRLSNWLFSLLIKVYLLPIKRRQIKPATKVLTKHLLPKSGIMINKLEFPLWLIFHPAALNYNRAIKEGSPLVVNSKRLQKKIPGLPMVSVQELFVSGQTDDSQCITWLYNQLPFCFSSERSAILLYWEGTVHITNAQICLLGLVFIFVHIQEVFWEYNSGE